MASQAHAFYCFEVLLSSFENSNPPKLKTIIDLFNKSKGQSTDSRSNTEDSTDIGTADGTEKIPTPAALPSILRLQADDSPLSSESSTPSNVSSDSTSSRTTISTTTDVSTNSYASRLSLTESYPMFVTWNVVSRSGHKTLRGCIGTFEALPLEQGLEQYSLTSAFEDTRFSPIPASLVPNLSCSLTLLADFEDCKNPFDWTLGTHGIRISFTHRYRRHGATYLPDVAVEQGWSKEETLESLMRKAGWESSTRRFMKGSSHPWEEVKDFHVVRYTGLKASASYAQWQEWRETVDLGSE